MPKVESSEHIAYYFSYFILEIKPLEWQTQGRVVHAKHATLISTTFLPIFKYVM